MIKNGKLQWNRHTAVTKWRLMNGYVGQLFHRQSKGWRQDLCRRRCLLQKERKSAETYPFFLL